MEQNTNPGEDILVNMAHYAEKLGVIIPQRPEAGGAILTPNFKA